MASSLEECKFLECLRRKRVKITLPGTQVTGVIQRINLNKTVILEDVYDVKSGRKFPGVKLFFGHDIIKVEFPFSGSQDELSYRSHADEAQKSNTQSSGTRTVLDHGEHEDSVNYVLIDELQEKFGPAVTHIKEQKVIGIEADFFEQERLCWFKVATKNVVYLFDILLLGGRAFKNGLIMILENHHILKVTHDCRSIAGCLKAQFGVSLTNVFDTQVADVMLFHKDTGGFLPDRVSTLQEVVRLHLNVPISEMFPFWAQEQCTKENPEVWYIRPCPPALLTLMAVSVIYLLPLRLVLLNALMSDYTNLVDSYLGSSQNQSLDMIHFGKMENELPKEVRLLEAVRQNRLKWAAHCYNITDDGLLERSSFKPCHPS